PPAAVDDVAGARRHPGRALEERRVAADAHEADLLALDGVRRREAGRASHGPDVRLREPAERELEPLEQWALERSPHVALVVRRVQRAGDHWPPPLAGDARVVAGREAAGADERRGLGEHAEANGAVAGDAGVGSASRPVGAYERLDHPAPEALRDVEREV